MEIWMDIKGYEGMYQISNLGQVKSFKHNKNKTIKQRVTHKKGYYQVSLCKNGLIYSGKIHKLVARAFIPNLNNLPQVHHKDGNKLNNNLENLEWVSISEHSMRTNVQMIGIKRLRHTYRQRHPDRKWGIGLNRKGENHPYHKVSAGTVLLIRKYREENPKISYRKISILFNTTIQIVAKVVRRETWGHLN